ncbi:MAG TPA: hypothetical protein VMT17_16160 [Anaeromyxobacteraceae bacterium]|nr:hypothetical protein [Anaeromyxobacteraceae bacterium]
MYRLFVWASVLGSLLVVATFVPFGGRTLAERWRAAPSAVDFAEQAAKEVAASAERLWGEKVERRGGARAGLQAPKDAGRGASRSGATAPKGSAALQERHTEADRNALDRIVAERSGPSR